MSDFYIASYELNDNTLSHYGVKGMHWGVRRYVNRDGSYTPKGYKKYGGEKAEKYRSSEKSIHTKKLRKQLNKGNTIKANKAMRQIKALNKMTEEDLMNEQIGIYQTARRLGTTNAFIFGLTGLPFVAINAAVETADVRNKRAEKFAENYKDMSIEQLEKEYKKIS